MDLHIFPNFCKYYQYLYLSIHIIYQYVNHLVIACFTEKKYLLKQAKHSFVFSAFIHLQ